MFSAFGNEVRVKDEEEEKKGMTGKQQLKKHVVRVPPCHVLFPDVSEGPIGRAAMSWAVSILGERKQKKRKRVNK